MKKKNLYFLDTNILISNLKKDDGRLKNLNFKKNEIFVTEVVKGEIEKLLKNEKYYKLTDIKYNILSFEDIRKQHPEYCSLYYNGIACMNNPALINSERFFNEALLALPESQKEMKLYNKVLNISSDLLIKISEYEKNIYYKNDDNNKKDDIYEIMLKNNLNFLKKKKESRKNKMGTYLNDPKNIILSLFYSLYNDKKVSFVTADIDYLYNILDYIQEISQHSIFLYEILNYLKTNNINYTNFQNMNLNLDIYLNSKNISEKINELYANIISLYNIKKYNFIVKYWDIENKRYLNMKFYFNKVSKDLILNNHGNMQCYGRNISHGNWISYKYFWPPKDLDKEENLKINITSKNILESDISVDEKTHINSCKYIKDDLDKTYTSFTSRFSENSTL